MDAPRKEHLLDVAAYLASAVQSLVRRPILLPAILLLLGLTATNSAALLYRPAGDSTSAMAYSLTLLVRIAVLFIFSVAIFRLAVGSTRRTWLPDGGFWLYGLLITLVALVPTCLQILLGDINSPRTSLLSGTVGILIVSLLSPWLVAAAVERPLAWRPTDWLRRFDRWCPHRLLWALLLIIPLVTLQSLLPPGPFVETGWFWPIVVAYSALGFLILIIRLGLDVVAYRRVAQD